VELPAFTADRPKVTEDGEEATQQQGMPALVLDIITNRLVDAISLRAEGDIFLKSTLSAASSAVARHSTPILRNGSEVGV
jgi:hypothetical protein